jgi:HSP20 family protein
MYHYEKRGDKIMMPIRRVQNWLPDVFNDFFTNDWIEKVNVTSPAINVLETETGFKVEVAACGMTKDDFNVHIDEEENLIISMEKKEEKKEEKKNHRYLRREFSYSNFRQTLILPDNADKENITANVENGVLHIEIPKLKEVEIKKQQKPIEVK